MLVQMVNRKDKYGRSLENGEVVSGVRAAEEVVANARYAACVEFLRWAVADGGV
jgi:hypothetical protein